MSSPIITPGPFLETVAYYQNRVTSEYNSGASPNMLAWLAANVQLGLDIAECLNSMLSTAFQLSTAVGIQIDTIGALLGISRTLPFQPTGVLLVDVASGGATYSVGQTVTIVQSGGAGARALILNVIGGAVTGLAVLTQGNGYHVASGLATTTGGPGTGLTVNIVQCVSPVLDDTTYRTALRAQVAKNHWNGQLASLQPIWRVIFPGGTLSIQDNQNMTASVYLAGSFSSVLIDMIENDMIVPRPQGVLFTFTLATMPMFGFDFNNAFIAGFDIGHFT
jgi:hypothetical protein